MRMTNTAIMVGALVASSASAQAETSELKELQKVAIIAGALLACSQDSELPVEVRGSFVAFSAELENRIGEYLARQYKQIALKDASSKDRATEVSEIDKRAEKLTLLKAEGVREIQKNEITCLEAAGTALEH